MLDYLCFMVHGLIFLTGPEEIDLLKGKSYPACLARSRVDLRMGGGVSYLWSPLPKQLQLKA